MTAKELIKQLLEHDVSYDVILMTDGDEGKELEYITANDTQQEIYLT